MTAAGRGLLGLLGRGLPLLGTFYLAFYYPYPAGSAPARWLGAYLELLARAAGAVLRLFDPEVTVQGTHIGGPFPMQVVLDCAALDAHAVLAAAVLAYPAPVAHKALGLAAGTVAIAFANLGRIVILQRVGLHFPAAFPLLHEEVLQLGLVLVAVATSAAWLSAGRRAHAA